MACGSFFVFGHKEGRLIQPLNMTFEEAIRGIVRAKPESEAPRKDQDGRKS